MTKNKQEFQKLCSELIQLYQETFNKTISVMDIIELSKFKSIYRELAKVYHSDKGSDGNKMSELNRLRDELRVFLIDSEFVSSIVGDSKDVDFDLNEYRRNIVNKFKAKQGDYKEILDIFEDMLYEFENAIIFRKNKAQITKEYYDFLKDLDVKLIMRRDIKQKISYLRGFVDNRNEENVKLFYEFKNKVEGCYNIGDVAELYMPYEISLRKNALSFLAKDSLSRLCSGYQDEELSRYIEEAAQKVKLVDYTSEDEFMRVYILYSNKIGIRRKNLECYEKLDSLMKSCINANYEGIHIGEVLKCTSVNSADIVFESLKESITSRIDYSKRVSAKIMGFLNKCKQNPENSFTYPFVFEKANRLFGYYEPMDKDLSKFDIVLANLEKEIEKQREIDQEKAANKKDTLRNKFNVDFVDGIFLKNGQGFLDYSLEQIDTFGGFADYENKVVKMELPRVVADVYNYLVDVEERLNGEKNIEDKKDRLSLLKKAMSLTQVFAKVCKDTKDYSAIKVSNSTVVDYRTFSRMVQTLKNIDYLNCTIDELVDKFAILEEFLYGDEFDDELENMFNKSK